MSPQSAFCIAPLLAVIGISGLSPLSEMILAEHRSSSLHPVLDVGPALAFSSLLSKRSCAPQGKCDEAIVPYASEFRPQKIRLQDDGDMARECSNESARPGERINACTALLLSSATEVDQRPYLYAQRGLAYYRAGANDMAVADFNTALELDPALLLALNGRCWIRAIRDVELDNARRDCDAAIALDPEFHEALDSRAMVSMRQERWNDAWIDFNAAVSLRDDVAVYLYGRGLASLALRNQEAGNADLSRARALDRGIDRLYREFGLDAAAPPFVSDEEAHILQDN